MEYAFEIDRDSILHADPLPTPSLFTSALVRRLSNGDPAPGQDGLVSVDQLYEYVFDEVRSQTTKQTPSRWFDVEGNLIVARVRHGLPEQLRQRLGDPLPVTRLGAIPELSRLAMERSPSIVQAARQALEQLTADDSRSVSAEAARALGALPSPMVPTQPPPSRDWAVRHGYSSDRLGVGWRATVCYLFCFPSSIPFLKSRNVEVRFNAWQAMLIDVAGLVILLAGALLAVLVDTVMYGGNPPTETLSSTVFAVVFPTLYLGGRLLALVQAWRTKHFRLPVIGRFAEGLALKR
jgi:uncharacterized membrane protein